MTYTTEQTATSGQSPCPPWCDGCAGETHFSGLQPIPLGHMPPEKFNDPMSGDEAWTAPTLDVTLCQRPDVAWPTFSFSVGEGPEVLRLSVFEAMQLRHLLTDMLESVKEAP
jgi:hypothetical protein